MRTGKVMLGLAAAAMTVTPVLGQEMAAQPVEVGVPVDEVSPFDAGAPTGEPAEPASAPATSPVYAAADPVPAPVEVTPPPAPAPRPKRTTAEKAAIAAGTIAAALAALEAIKALTKKPAAAPTAATE